VFMREDDLDFTIARLGECRFPSPLSGVRFTRDDERASTWTRAFQISA
jgi:6-phosphofructokinase 1